MNPYEGPWRNTEPCFKAAMYIQMCRPDELASWNRKLYSLIERYGSAFDDVWHYWLNKRGTWIRRTPVDFPKRIVTEKPRRYEPNKKLAECILEASS